MTAERWLQMADFLEWQRQQESEEEFYSLLPSLFSRLTQKKDEPASGGETVKQENPSPPTIIPILPLRGVVVYPQTAVPLTIGQPRSIRLIDDVVSGDKLVGLVASQKPEIELPGPADLFSVGTLSIVHRLLRAQMARCASSFRGWNASA